VLLPVELYAPGAKLPPHLSPFIPSNTRGYVPEYRKKLDRFIQLAQGNTEAAEALEADEEDKNEPVPDEDNVEDDDDEGEASSNEESGEDNEADEEDKDTKARKNRFAAVGFC